MFLSQGIACCPRWKVNRTSCRCMKLFSTQVAWRNLAPWILELLYWPVQSSPVYRNPSRAWWYRGLNQNMNVWIDVFPNFSTYITIWKPQPNCNWSLDYLLVDQGGPSYDFFTEALDPWWPEVKLIWASNSKPNRTPNRNPNRTFKVKIWIYSLQSMNLWICLKLKSVDLGWANSQLSSEAIFVDSKIQL